MSSEKKIFGFIIGFILVGLAVAAFFPKEEERNRDAWIRIGAGDDVSGVLMQEIADDLIDRYQVANAVESSSFQDC